jgi:hypothetical protein
MNTGRVVVAIPRISISGKFTTTKKTGFLFQILFIQFPVPITPFREPAFISTNSTIPLDIWASKGSHVSILGYKTLFHF